jgi:hypothetical protein
MKKLYIEYRDKLILWSIQRKLRRAKKAESIMLDKVSKLW